MTTPTLEDLYQTRDTLRKLGESQKDLEESVRRIEESISQLEEDIIKKEILPELKRTIEPALKPVQRELVLVVDYMPGEPISVHLSRERNFTASIPDAKEMVLDPEVEHTSREGSASGITRSASSDMAVYFPDGTTIAERYAVDTLYETVKKIGVERVRQVVEEQELVFNKVPVISNRRDSKYGRSQKPLGNGWFLMTHSNNKQKKTLLEKLSRALDLGLKVELREDK